MKPPRPLPIPEYVRKVRTAVRVALPGLDLLEGFISLAPRAEHHDGPQTILERLNGPDRFVPIQRSGERDVMLVNPLDIESVEPLGNVPLTLVLPPAFRITHEERVRVRFMSGRQVEGVLRFELPDELNRVSDFLNADEDFFALHLAHGTLLVNKRRISLTRLYEASPRPARGERSAPATGTDD
uniref:Uncharacterized protein n=1 Tax=Eiseniibacteriota bacterium TaxID=2212470 RepID=A0A832I303_UNCEI